MCNQFMTQEDIFSLFEKFQDNGDAICDFFMQEHAYPKMVNVSKLFYKRVQNLFKSYINQGKNFADFRYNFIVSYLKKLILKYYLKKSNSLPKAN